MKQEMILSIAILSLLSLAVFVTASMTPYSSDGYNHNVKVYLSKGWNLVLSTDLDKISDTSSIKQSDILATYIYAPEERRYMQLHPDKSEFNSYVSGLSEFSEDAGRIMISPMWIYSNKEGYIEYSRVDVPKIYDITLIQGWNFITVTPEMEGYSLNQLEGSCNIEKAYWWNSETDETEQGTNWKDFPLSDFEFGEETGDSIFGTGIIIKVTNSCKLATDGSSTNPPSLPSSAIGSSKEIKKGDQLYFYNNDCSTNLYVQQISQGGTEPIVAFSYAPGGGFSLGEGEQKILTEKTFIWFRNVSNPSAGNCLNSEISSKQINLKVDSINLDNKQATITID